MAKEKQRETLKNKQKPYFRGKQFFNEKQRQESDIKTEQTKQKQNEEGLGSGEVARSPQKKEKTQKYQKKSFSVISHFFVFCGCPQFPFFDNLAKKTCTQKTL